MAPSAVLAWLGAFPPPHEDRWDPCCRPWAMFRCLALPQIQTANVGGGHTTCQPAETWLRGREWKGECACECQGECKCECAPHLCPALH